MRKTVVAGLLATISALVPGMASAQDGTIRDAMRERMQARIERQQHADDQRGARPQQAPQPSAERGGWQRPQGGAPNGSAPAGGWQRGGGNWRGNGDANTQPGGWQGRDRGDRSGRPDWNRPAPGGDARQPDPQRGGWNGRPNGSNWQGQAPRPDWNRGDNPQRNWNRGDAPRPNWNRGDANRGDWRRDDDRRAQRFEGGNRGNWGADRNWGRQDWSDRRGFDDRRNWNRGWRQDDRYDWSRYRASNRYAYRLPRYYAPYGWNDGYRRFSIGVRLSPLLFAESYWIDDPYAYRLPEAYGPYRWVRYYNDALLVDVYSGQVVDVIYDIFW